MSAKVSACALAVAALIKRGGGVRKYCNWTTDMAGRDWAKTVNKLKEKLQEATSHDCEVGV